MFDEWLKGNIEHGGDRKTKSRLQDVTLKNIGVSKIESHRLQRIAEIPEAKFERLNGTLCQKGIIGRLCR